MTNVTGQAGAFSRSTLARRGRWVAAIALALIAPSILAGRVPIAIFVGVAAVSLIVAAIARPPALSWPLMLRRPIVMALGLLFVLWLVPLCWTINAGFSAQAYFQTLGVVLFGGMATVILMDNYAVEQAAARVFLLSAVFCLTMACIAVFVWPPVLSAFRLRQVPDIANAARSLKGFGSLMPCITIVALWYGWRLGGRWRWIAGSICALGVLLVVGVGSKAAILGYLGALFAGLFCLALVTMRRWWAGVTCLLVVAATIAVAATVVSRLPAPPYQGPASLRISTSLIDEHRQIIWGFSLDRFAEKPWFGWGLATSGHVPGARVMVPGLKQEYVPAHSHNWAVQVALEAGVVGLTGLLLVLVVFFFYCVRLGCSDLGKSLAAASLWGAYLCSGLVNFSFWAAWWQTAIVALLALIFSARSINSKPRR